MQEVREAVAAPVMEAVALAWVEKEVVMEDRKEGEGAVEKESVALGEREVVRHAEAETLSVVEEVGVTSTGEGVVT